jgi:type VI secretion system protein VasJ
VASLLEDLLKPISDGTFCGEDASYESEYETARAEADKISENNFALMADCSKKLLTKKSKDMRSLGYLVLGTAMSDGLTSFGEAVQAYCKLATEHWNDIHPKRATARANALKWLNLERNVGLLTGLNGGGDYETLKKASEDISAFQTFIDGKFPEGPPTFGSFAKVVREHAQKNKPVEKPPEPTAAEAAAQAATQAAASAGPAKIASADDAFMAVQNASYFLLEQNRATPIAYRFNRMLKWSGMSELPPSDNGRTAIPVPPPHVLEIFRGQFEQKQWPSLIASGEDTFAGEGLVFWLDLQRYICTALNASGGDYAPCAKAILIELALLLKTVPDLPTLQFDDGTPFADSMTKEWIQNEVISALGGGGGGAGLAPIKKKGDVGEEQKQAEALLSEGKLEQAMMVLRVGLANDSSQKNNFDRKLIMAELCFKGNKAQISKALLEDLTAVIERNGLAQWDVDLCVSVYHLAQKVYLSLAESADEITRPAFREKAVAMHTQISKLNPVLAIGTDFK